MHYYIVLGLAPSGRKWHFFGGKGHGGIGRASDVRSRRPGFETAYCRFEQFRSPHFACVFGKRH